ncbi:BatD family protein [uncultured Psychromonas sp.]|uniref:BatD family protein n=1 Tax=uncultured Psychromonas sp. TaxID=173974 RepID=UPI0026193839|nr:BatD family protein [uncultured Psychromonas sp.]
MQFLQKCLTIILLSVSFSMPAISETQATASVNSNSVFLGDTFILTVEVNDTGSDYQFDTSELNNDFVVGRPSRSQQTSYINGEFTQQITWTLRLQAKELGELTIPSFQIGDVSTQAIKIEVNKPGKQQQSTANDTIFIESTINKNKVYIDQPVILESKIYVAESISNADVQAPILEGATIEQIVLDQPASQIVRNGLRYQVFTYQYTITPSTSGEVTITSPLLTGAVQKIQQVNSYQQRRVTQAINIRGNDLELSVKEMPANFQGDWLVSEDVRLIENNDLQAKEYTVGDPITRSISLQVASIALDKMPEIALNYDSALRYYPDQDDLKQGTIDNILYSQRTITHAIIPNKSGELVLPEIKIAWWNSKTEKQEFATLPAQTLTIKPALTNNTANDSNNSNMNNSTDQSLLTAAAQQKQNNIQHSVNDDQSTQLIIWQVSTLVLLLLLMLLSFYHLNVVKNNKVIMQKPKLANSKSQQYKALLSALKQAKPNDVYASLLRYFQSQYPSIKLLQQISSFTNLSEENKQQLQQNLQELELACSEKTHHWDAKKLLILIKLHHQVTSQSDLNHITNLNP